MRKTVCAPCWGVKRPLYRICWRGLRLEVRAAHAEILQLLRLLSASSEGVAICLVLVVCVLLWRLGHEEER